MAGHEVFQGIDVWGLSGVMGSGKSAALDYLKLKAFPVSDTDRLAREIWSVSYPRHAEIRDQFRFEVGSAFLDTSGTLKRDELRAAVATNPKLRVALEKCTHPHILHLLSLRVQEAKARGSKAYFVEGTRLIESGAMALLKGLIVVESPRELALERIRSRSITSGHMSEAEALALLSTQDQEKMKQFASVIWANDGDLEHLQKQIDEFLSAQTLL